MKKKHVSQDEFGLVFRSEMTLRERIERAWGLFHSVIPQDSAERGRRRTPFFYRQQAIAWARHHRQRMFPKSDVCLKLAKSYLDSYRKLKGLAA